MTGLTEFIGNHYIAILMFLEIPCVVGYWTFFFIYNFIKRETEHLTASFLFAGIGLIALLITFCS